MSTHYNFYFADWKVVLEKAKEGKLDMDRLWKKETVFDEETGKIKPEHAHWIEGLDFFLSDTPFSNHQRADGVYDFFREQLPDEMKIETDRFFIAIDPTHSFYHQEHPYYEWTPEMITFREKILEPEINKIDFNLALSPDIINMIVNLRFSLEGLETYFDSEKMIALRKEDEYHFLDFETFKRFYQGWVEIFDYCSRKKGWGLLVYIG